MITELCSPSLTLLLLFFFCFFFSPGCCAASPRPETNLWCEKAGKEANVDKNSGCESFLFSVSTLKCPWGWVPLGCCNLLTRCFTGFCWPRHHTVGSSSVSENTHTHTHLPVMPSHSLISFSSFTLPTSLTSPPLYLLHSLVLVRVDRTQSDLCGVCNVRHCAASCMRRGLVLYFWGHYLYFLR